MKQTKRFFEELQKREEQRKMATGAGSPLANNCGMNTYLEVALICLVVLVVGGLLYGICKKMFPELFNSINTKLTEMLNQWNITAA